MINKFAIRNLFLVLIGFFSLCLFGYDCEKSFASLANDKKYQELGIELARARSKVKERLETTPAELLSPLAPSFSALEKIDVSQIRKETKLIPGSFLSAKSLKPILQIFKKYRGDADFVFVGNGYYIPYLMAKSMFAGTPMESRIKFVAFSRDLAGKAAAKPEQFENYFKSIGLGESKRKMVVIDSITSLDSGNDHSVIRTSNAIRSFLMAKGWPPSEAIQSVITLGMPEGNAQQAYRAQSLEEYERKLSEVTAKKGKGATYPYWDPGISYEQGPFVDSYDYWGGNYWNGKYQSLDNLGIPRGIEDIRPGLDRISLPELDEMISDRASRVTYYQTIIKTAKENAKLLSKEIEAVVRSRSSN